jgi:hypothetical protein
VRRINRYNNLFVCFLGFTEVFLVFLPAMQRAALSCRDLVRKGAKELPLTSFHAVKGGED